VRVETAKAAMVVNMLAEGVGIRAIARLTGLNKNTVLNVLETAGQHCEQLLNDKLVNLQVENVEIDEVYGFVNTLEINTDPQNVNDRVKGDQYAFLAIERSSKLILSWAIGKRDSGVALEFLRDLKGRVAGRFQLTSDGFMAYCGRQDSLRSAGIGAVFGDDVDYGVEMKRYAVPAQFGPFKSRRENPPRLEWIKHLAKIGNPDFAKMTVNHMERANLSIRLFNRRFTRKTLGYSKILRNHRLAVALQIAHYDFCRVHSAHNQTPAMAAGLTDHVWTVEELLAANV